MKFHNLKNAENANPNFVLWDKTTLNILNPRAIFNNYSTSRGGYRDGISYSTSACGITVLLKTLRELQYLSSLAALTDTWTCHICGPWCTDTMTCKPIKTHELQYTMARF